MVKYISNKGGGQGVDFETAILDGYAIDGGLYVPTHLPEISMDQLRRWKNLSYTDLAFQILSLFIDRSVMSEAELKSLISEAYASFEQKDIIPLYKLKSREDAYIMELFYGPTISFKDIGMAFLVNLVNFFLNRKDKRLSIIVATTGDTGPAAAHFIAGKSNMDAWVLYPKGMITEEQERQMTTLQHANIHPVGVSNCPDGGDDLDAVISRLYANKVFKEKLQLSSVNSLNWGRIMMQTVHYFFGYFRVVDAVGEEVNIAVPSGGFGNVCAGSLARIMGLPIKTMIVANNDNACLHRIFSEGFLSKVAIFETLSSAIDILIPINFWRYLYFTCGKDTEKIKTWIDTFESEGLVRFDEKTFDLYSNGFLSHSSTDEDTLKLIKEIYESEDYLLDPHGAVALAAADYLKDRLGKNKLICLATAHPAKFPAIIRKALGTHDLPQKGTHPGIERAKKLCQKTFTCDFEHLETALIHAMESNLDLNVKNSH